MKRAVILVIMGSLYGSVGDFLHCVHEITVYKPTRFLQPNGTPLWTLFLFGAAGLAIGLGFEWFKHVCKTAPSLKFRQRTSAPHAFMGGLFFLGLYTLSAYIGKMPEPVPDLCLALLSLLFWKIFDGTTGSLIFGLAVGLFGTAAEIFLVHFDCFSYGSSVTQIFGVACWLPWLYVTAGIATADSSLLLRKG